MIARINAGGRVSPRQMREAINEVSEILNQLKGIGCRVVRNGTRWTVIVEQAASGGGGETSDVITAMRWNENENRIEVKTAKAAVTDETDWTPAIYFSEFDA